MPSKKTSYLSQFIYIFRKLLAYYKGHVVAYSLLIIVSGFLPQLDAFVIGRLIDNVLSYVNTAGTASLSEQSLHIVPMVLIVLGIFFAIRFIYDLQSYVAQKYELKLQNFRDLLEVNALVNLPPHVYEDDNFIALKNVIDYNLWKLGNIVYWTISIAGAIISNLVIVIVFISYSPLILLSALLSLIAPSIIRLKFGKKIWGIWDSLSDRKVVYSMYRSPLYSDEPSKFVETKVFGYGSYLLHKFIDVNSKFVESLIKNERKRFNFMILSRVFEYTCVGFGFWLIFREVLVGRVSVGSLYFLITMYNALRTSTTYTLEQVTNVMADAPFMKSLHEFLTFEPKYQVKSGETILENKAPFIELKDVWFKYPGTETWVLKGVTLKIDAKTDVALVGKNGAGKSTLIKLILRVYDVTSGEILVNRVNIKDIALEDYYKQVGILSQDFHKFRFTAGENISIGDVSKTENVKDQVLVASKKAQADEFISKYEKGYDTYLTRELKGGITPSGGQQQRIAIARVFYKNPNLIILDEPTSAIDSLAEEQIFANIKDESKEKTVIIISHRFATVKKADYIYVLEDGVIKEHGTHEKLVDNNGLYNQMYIAQQS